jgi:hypothetical protein
VTPSAAFSVWMASLASKYSMGCGPCAALKLRMKKTRPSPADAIARRLPVKPGIAALLPSCATSHSR